MDNKTFVGRVAKQTGIDAKETAMLAESLCSIIATALAEGDNVVVPGFGSFDTRKYDEKISVDLSTGRRLLMPPAIEVEFTAATALKKQL